MKRFLLILLSLLTAVIMSVGFSACGTYTPANPSRPGTGNNPFEPDPETGENPFTATLVFDGRPFIPKTEITAKWTDGYSVYSAPFNSNGVAVVYGLDGDYAVTLSGLPDGYTYNANIYKANNDKRNVEIELLELITYYGKGTDLYTNVIELGQLGAYRVTFTEAGQQIFCEYRPEKSGLYAIESIIDVNANEVNPRLDVYVGNSAWKPDSPNYSLDTGGVSSVYTKNFRYEVSVANTGSVYSFALKFDKRSHVELPVNIDFIITRNGDFETESVSSKLILPTESFKQTPEYPASQYVFKNFGKSVGDRTLLDGSQVYLSPTDGYYHYKYTDASGAVVDTVLYVLLTKPNNLVDFFDENVRLNVSGRNYYYFIRGFNGYATTVGGEANIPADVLQNINALDRKSYMDYVNSDGVYAVTPEMKTFLLAYSKQNALFLDGNGWGESNGYDSSEADQWLFACGYYESL